MNDQKSYINDIIAYLETGKYLRNSSFTTAEVIKQIYEFSMFFNSTGRAALLNADQNECQELVSLLLNLKKNIKFAISELGQSQSRKSHHYVCPECDELIEGQSNSNIWSIIQQHEHLEKLYSEFSYGTRQITIKPPEMEPLPSTSKVSSSECNDTLETEHTDSGIDYEETPNENCSPEEEEPLGSNTFRFNFMPLYDPVVEETLYTKKLKSLNKYSSCKLPTIQKINQCRASCLLCNCHIKSVKKISHNQCVDHIVGQRHARAANDTFLLTALESYHKIFWNLETCYQAHQVYFEPKNTTTIRCHLCCVGVPFKGVVDHIQSVKHKNTVLGLFLKKKTSEFLLLNVQVEAYGVKAENIQNENPTVETPEKKVRERREKTKPSSDGKQENSEVEHNIISRPNPCVTLQDFIPHRYKEHSKYLKDKVTYICCDLCQRNFNNKTEDIMDHFASKQHCQLANLPNTNYKYYCEICNMSFVSEAFWVKHFLSGKNSHSRVSKSRINKLTEHECVTCKVVFFGDDISVIRHKSKGGERRRETPKELKLAPEVIKMFINRETIEKEGNRLVKEASSTTTTCLNRTLDCCSAIEELLKTLLQYCKTYPFGSRMSGLGNEASDLDLFVDTGNMYFGCRNQDSLSQSEIVKKVFKVLNSRRDLFTKIRQVPTARTPIVKVQHIKTGLDCDLSFRHGLSVENTKFLRLCLDIQPISQALILVLKKWSFLNNLDEHITTYALAMLAIFYLQVNEYLLSVKELKLLNPKPAPVISGWETIEYTMSTDTLKNHVKQYEHSLLRLLKDFFFYYSTFNYQDDTVCPLLGHTINRKLFENPRLLPPEMSSYVKQLKSSKEPEQFRFMSPFCVQDPFDLSHNLTKACQGNTLATFRKLCEFSYKHLDSLK